MAAKILILKKVLRNNPTFRNFLWKNIGGLLWWPPTPPPPRGQKFWNYFSSNFRSNEKNNFCHLRQILFVNGFIATAADDLPTRSWQDPDKILTRSWQDENCTKKLWCQLDEILNKIIVVKNFILIGNAKWIFIRKYQLKGVPENLSIFLCSSIRSIPTKFWWL